MPVPTRGTAPPRRKRPWPRHSPSPGTRHTDKQWKYTYHHTYQEQEWVGGRKSVTDSNAVQRTQIDSHAAKQTQTGHTATLSSARRGGEIELSNPHAILTITQALT